MDYSLGLVEVSALGNAIIMLDDMLKAADVEFVATERKLGGRLVTIVVKGELTSVKASVDAGVRSANANDCLKAYQVIARPHPEILKFLHLDEEHEKKATSERAGTHVGKLPQNDEEKEIAQGEAVTVNETKTVPVKSEPASIVKPETSPKEEAPANKPVRRGRPKKTK